MHDLQPKHAKLSKDETAKLLSRLNVSVAQLPKISKKDVCVSENCDVGEVIKIERSNETYFRVVA